MPKERVIVFDGEDQFIAPRNMVYSVASGEANVVGEGRSDIIGGERPVVPPDGMVDSGAKKEFDDYMRRQGQTVSVPSPVEPDFCFRVKQFIQSNGEGMATPMQISEAHQLFQQYCVEKPKDTPIVPPVGEIKSDEEILLPKPPKVPVEDTPKPTTPAVTLPAVNLPAVNLTTPSLGARPSGGGGGGSAGGGEKPKEEKKTNWLLWLLVAAGVVYLATRKKD